MCRLSSWKQKEAVVRKARKEKPEGLFITGGDSSNKGCFGRKTNLFRESGDFVGNLETWEIFREM